TCSRGIAIMFEKKISRADFFVPRASGLLRALLLRAVGCCHFNIYTDSTLVNQLAAEVAGNRDKRRSQQGNIKPPRPDKCIGITDSIQPIKRCKREQHNGEGSVTPSGNQTANTRHRNQINQTHGTGNPSAQGTDTRKPQTGSGPKIIIGNKIGNISCDQSQQGGHRKMNQHRMNRMATEGHLAHDGFLHIVPLIFFKKLQQLVLCFSVAQKITFQRLTIFLTPFFVAGCSGPFSALDPAGPAARSAALLWWSMFAYATLVLIAVVGLWLYAMRRPQDTGDEQHQRRIHNRWILGGGVVLPTVSIILLLIFGIPIGQRMLPLPPADGEAVRIEVIGH